MKTLKNKIKYSKIGNTNIPILHEEYNPNTCFILDLEQLDQDILIKLFEESGDCINWEALGKEKLKRLYELLDTESLSFEEWCDNNDFNV